MRSTFFLSILIACAISATAQTSNKKLADIAASLNDINKQLPVEKVHLHIDKPYYSVGDTIWIKAYVAAQNNQLSALSNVVHVDLINDDDQITTSLAMPVSGGQAWGALTLTDTSFTAGNYILRAYTNVMRNFDNAYFYNRSLGIGNALPIISSDKKSGAAVVKPLPINSIAVKTDKNINLEFFPEGGDLISNIVANIAFKATGEDGLSRDVEGYIVDQNNNRVASFASEHAGMGTFSLFAQSANKYMAVVTNGTQEERFALPQARDVGYTLSARQDKDNLFVKIISSTATDNADTVNLIAQANNEILYSGKAAINGQGLITTISKKRFPNGILQLTLFNKDFAPVAERLVFIRQHYPFLQLNLVESAKKGKNDLLRFDFTPTDAAGKTVTGAFSVAVTDADKVTYDEQNETSIFADLLLTSELKGYIEQPNYYFSDTLAIKQKHLDNLLLTQGWRRFAWNDILTNNYKPGSFKPERVVVSGTVSDNKKQPIAGARVALFVKNGAIMVIDTVSDALGRFTFDNVLPDKGDDYKITATNDKGKSKYNVQLDKPENVSTPPPVAHLPYFSYKGFEKYIESARLDYEGLDDIGQLNLAGELLNEVNINEKKKPTVKEIATKHSANMRGGGNADQTITFIDLLPCSTATDLAGCLIGKLNNIRFLPDRDPNPATRRPGLFPYMRGNESNMGLGPMAVYVNGAYSPHAYEGSISEIAAIEIIRPASTTIYGTLGAAGVMLITTKTGDVDYFAYEQEHLRQNGKARQTLSNLSFAPRREFYTPQYKLKEPVVDLRSTVYWKPDIITDKSSETIEFAKGKTGANYRIVIEGVDTEGRLGRKVIDYTVK